MSARVIGSVRHEHIQTWHVLAEVLDDAEPLRRLQQDGTFELFYAATALLIYVPNQTGNWKLHLVIVRQRTKLRQRTREMQIKPNQLGQHPEWIRVLISKHGIRGPVPVPVQRQPPCIVQRRRFRFLASVLAGSRRDLTVRRKGRETSDEVQ